MKGTFLWHLSGNTTKVLTHVLAEVEPRAQPPILMTHAKNSKGNHI